MHEWTLDLHLESSPAVALIIGACALAGWIGWMLWRCEPCQETEEEEPLT